MSLASPMGPGDSYPTPTFLRSRSVGPCPASNWPNPYELVVETDRGEQVEIPWDFARHYCDASYRPAIEAIAMQGRQTLGARIRDFRESAGLTQEALAHAANIGRVTLVRLEKGEQSPRFRTLDAIARALGKRVSELLVEPERLLQ